MVTSEPSDLMSEMKLYGHDDNWFRSDGLGTTYEITDISGSKIFYAGQLCGKDQGGSECDIDLPEGSYIWRVNGALDPNRDEIAWFFCDSQGGARTELLFDVDNNNHCIPVHKRFSNDKEDEFNPDDVDVIHNERNLDKKDEINEDKHIVLLQGSIDLIGLNSLQLSDHDRSLLEHFITSQFHELKVTPPHFSTDSFDETAHIVQWQEVVLDSYYRTGRGDHPVIDRVTFNIPIHVDTYRLSGLTNTTTELITNFKRYIGLVMESGAFLSRVHHKRDSNLQLINKVKFIDLKKISEINNRHSRLSNDILDVPLEVEDILILLGMLFGFLIGYQVFRVKIRSMMNGVNVKKMYKD